MRLDTNSFSIHGASPSSLGSGERCSELVSTSCPYLHPSPVPGLSKLVLLMGGNEKLLPTLLCLRLDWGGSHGWSDSETPLGQKKKEHSGYEVGKWASGG